MAKHERMTAAAFLALRESFGTQEEVADAMETDRRTIGRWERGERPVPGVAAVCIRLLVQDKEMKRTATLEAVAQMGDPQ